MDNLLTICLNKVEKEKETHHSGLGVCQDEWNDGLGLQRLGGLVQDDVGEGPRPQERGDGPRARQRHHDDVRIDKILFKTKF